ncbi:MAG: T9SS type A sorting domain-containing protein [Salibacteraceae bacterium]|nr:T9SS type A sorting domain-containing protein [Salibacteraceae bacterium]
MRKTLLYLFFAFGSFATISAQSLLYDQTANVGTSGILCRAHTDVASQIYDTEGVDDFTIPTGATWSIDSIVAPGFYNVVAPNASKTIVTIYNDNSGLPGTVAWADTLNDGDPDNDGTLEPHFIDPIVLTGGTYWLSVKLYTSTTPWYWNRITAQVSNYQFLWQNPNGGYAVCTSWAGLNPCLAIADSSVAFQIYGCEGIKPSVDLGPDTTLCQNVTYTLATGSSNANFQHLWSNNAVTTSIQVSQAGVYTVTVLDLSSNCTTIKSVDIDVSNPIINSLADDTTCLGVPKVFAVAPCNTCSVLWSSGSTNNLSAFSTDGYVSVVSTDAISGCTESDSAYLTVIDPGLVLLPGNVADLCAGSEITLSTTLNYENYLWWDMQNPALFTDSITIDQDGYYFVTVTDANGCEAEDSVLVILRPNPTPIINSQFDNSWNIRLSTQETHDSYVWSNGGTDPITTVTTNGLYRVTVTNEFGCEGTAFVSVYTIGVSEEIANQLKLYPNPATDYFQIEWPSGWLQNAQSTLYNIEGKIVMQFSVTQQNQRIDVANLTKGTYILATDSPDGLAKTTIIIQ